MLRSRWENAVMADETFWCILVQCLRATKGNDVTKRDVDTEVEAYRTKHYLPPNGQSQPQPLFGCCSSTVSDGSSRASASSSSSSTS